MKERKAKESQVRERYLKLKSSLTERARRLFVANEAIAFGYGGIAAAARASGMAPSVIGKGMAEVRAIEDGTAPTLPATRSRRPGGGRKKTTETDPTLLPDLKALVESTTRGDPESALLWTSRSQRNIVAALTEQGHHTSMKMDSRLLKELGYSLQAFDKRLEGTQHPDRNAQRAHRRDHPATTASERAGHLGGYQEARNFGPYKNAGSELRAKGDPEDVTVHDFVDPDKGRAGPTACMTFKKTKPGSASGSTTPEFAVNTMYLVAGDGHATLSQSQLSDHGRRWW